MSTPTLTRAAELLELDAAEMLLCWGDAPEARKARYEIMQVAAELRAMLAAAPRHPAVGEPWPTRQPIETAPKDGTSILLITAAGIVEAAWAHGSWEQSVIECSYAGAGWPVFACQPTHWMPLPPDPGEAAQPADVARKEADRD